MSLSRIPQPLIGSAFLFLALFLAPLLAAGTPSSVQLLLALLLILATIAFLPSWIHVSLSPWLPRCLAALAILYLVHLFPLPAGFVEWLSPERVQLAREVAVDPSRPPSWLTLSMSPAATLQRLLALALAVAVFSLARQISFHPGGPVALAGCTLAALVATSGWVLYHRWADPNTVLGLWEITWHNGAGTFVNRNHFANWAAMAILFGFGWVLRALSPLQSTRSTSPPPQRLVSGLLAAALLLAALLVLLSTGSRGGILALLSGLAAFLILLTARSRNRQRIALVSFVAIAAFLLLLLAAGSALDRFSSSSQVDTDSVRTRLYVWKLAWSIFLLFPVFGSGPGSFPFIADHLKEGFGRVTFTHAENEWVQILAELGALGAALTATLLLLLMRPLLRTVLRLKLTEPEIAIGAGAALVAFLTHTLVDFPFHIPANMILVSALAGLLAGLWEQRPANPSVRPASRAQRAWIALPLTAWVAIITLQSIALFHDHTSRSKPLPERARLLSRSLQFWPFQADRQIRLSRLRAAQLIESPRSLRRQLLPRFRSEVIRVLQLDPFNWQLLLELAWFDIAFHPDQEQGARLARQVLKWNRLHPDIALRFAEHFLARQSELGWQFLHQANLEDYDDVRAALLLAWRFHPDASRLWEAVPPTPYGFLALSNFALEKHLYPLAIEAFERLPVQPPLEDRLQRYLAAQRPDLVLRTANAAQTLSSRSQYLLAKAHLDLDQPATTLRLSESLWQNHPDYRTWTVTGNPPRANDPQLDQARRNAFTILETTATERSLASLRDLQRQHPRDPYLTWSLYKTHLNLQNYRQAARYALLLTELSLP